LFSGVIFASRSLDLESGKNLRPKGIRLKPLYGAFYYYYFSISWAIDQKGLFITFILDRLFGKTSRVSPARTKIAEGDPIDL